MEDQSRLTMQPLAFQVLTRLGTVPSTTALASYNHLLIIIEYLGISSMPETGKQSRGSNWDGEWKLLTLEESWFIICKECVSLKPLLYNQLTEKLFPNHTY